MRLLVIAATLLLTCSLVTPSASAHDQKELTILLEEGGPVPESLAAGVLVETDFLFFINVDRRENSTHRVQVDADNDGNFDGPDDLSTQWLQNSCSTDENGSKTEDDCMVNEFFLLAPENGLLPGNISMRHQIKLESETTNSTFYVYFGPDIHPSVAEQISPIDTSSPPTSKFDSVLVFVLVISILGILITAQKISRLDEEE